MKRREFLLTTGGVLAASAFPLGWTEAADKKRPKILYFTRSAGFQHSPVNPLDGGPSYSDKVLTALGIEHNVDIVCSKDGTVFDGDLDQYDAFAFYTCGDLCKPASKQKTPPMSPQGKKRLLAAIAGGKGFVGFHSAADTFHSEGEKNANQTELDPYIAMIGGEFIKHGAQQVATMRAPDPTFPGLEDVGAGFDLHEEWYCLKNFAKDMHVVLVQETEGMKGNCYQRPSFPATWARQHGKGRVFYTSLGHREDVWDNPLCQQIVIGGFSWALGHVEADLTPNLAQVTPEASRLSEEL